MEAALACEGAKIVVVTSDLLERDLTSFNLRDAEDKITSLERDLDDLRRGLDEVTRRVDAIEPRANGTYKLSVEPDARRGIRSGEIRGPSG